MKKIELTPPFDPIPGDWVLCGVNFSSSQLVSGNLYRVIFHSETSVIVNGVYGRAYIYKDEIRGVLKP